MKFEPTHINGQYYKTLSGKKVKIYSIEGSGGAEIHGAFFCDFSCDEGEYGWNMDTWDNNGKCSIILYSSEEDDLSSIVGYWEEPKKEAYNITTNYETPSWLSEKPFNVEFEIKGLNTILSNEGSLYENNRSEIGELSLDFSTNEILKWNGTKWISIGEKINHPFSGYSEELLKKYNNKIKICECGTDKHGFASHSDWCPKWEKY